MRKIFLSLMLVAGLSLGLQASPVKGNGHRGGSFKGLKELNLSQDQQEKLKTIHKDFRDQIVKLRENTSLTKDEKKAKIGELMAAKQAQVKSILTPEQQAKWDKARKERKSYDKTSARKEFRKDQKQTRHHRMGSENFAKKKMADLNLNSDQKAKAEALAKTFREKNEAIRNDQSLSKEAKREKRKELIAEHTSQFKSILTPDQQSKLQDHFTKSKKIHKAKEKRGERIQLSEQAKSDLKSLQENFIKEKKAVELSRISPYDQKDRIKELRDKYRTDRREIIIKERQKKS